MVDSRVFRHRVNDRWVTFLGSAGPVPANPPIAHFDAAPNVLVVHFDGSASTGGDATITDYLFNYGDGGTAHGAVQNHTYAQGGAYTVTLTIICADGQSDSYSQRVDVSSGQSAPPTVAFTPSVSGMTVTATAITTGAINSYLWDFGDGQQVGTRAVSHTYAAAGSYTITCTVVATDNQSASATHNVTTDGATPPPPPDDFITFGSIDQQRYHPSGSTFAAQENWWGLRTVANNTGVVWSSSLRVSPSTFPLRTTITWDVTPGPNYNGVEAYLYVCCGNYEKDQATLPGGSKQVSNITSMTVDQAWTWTGDNQTGILAEMFLDSAQIGPGAQGSHIRELAFFPRPSPGTITFFNGKPPVGSGGFTDKKGVTWVVKESSGPQGPFFIVARPDYSFFEGVLPFSDLFDFLIANGKITGSMWVNGVAIGPEPKTGAGAFTLDKFTVSIS